MEFDFSRYSKIVANDLSLNGSISSALGGLSQWSSSSSDIYYNDGNVGIGTTSPGSKLDIDGGSAANAGTDFIGVQLHANAISGAYNTSTATMTLDRGDYGGAISGYLEQNTGGGLTFSTISPGNSIERMRIDHTGRLGIGTTSPNGNLDINNYHGSGDRGKDQLYTVFGTYFGWRWYSRWNNRYWDIRYNTGGNGDVLHIYYQGNTSRGGFFDPNQNVGTFTFTGQHRNFIENIPSTEAEDYKGLIVSANKNAYYDIDYSIKTGKDAIKINDALPYVSLCKKEKDKSVYGVISDGEDGESRKYSAGTFVSVSEKQYGDNRMFINSVGEGAIWVSNKNGNLESGDYITTASIPGYGQKQDSEFLANYSVAKITMDCDFQPDYIYKKKVTTRNVDITGPDASGNYYDILNNERLYTIDLSNENNDNENKKYVLTFDNANNLIGATQNVLDEKGQVQWEDTTDQEYAYEIRHLDPSGNIITKEQHDTTISNGGSAYIAAFVGCTYHCG